MTTTPAPSKEPTLRDLADKLDRLAVGQERLAENQERLTAEQERFNAEQKQFDERFSTYQKATQWIVQLAFSLIASATITVIITVILNL